MYGNQLNGLVKTGIRLSYSKNPLGVRSGTSQVRRENNGLYSTGPWSAPPPTSGSESKFMVPTSPPFNPDRPTESAMHQQRRDSTATTTELSPNASHFSFIPHQGQLQPLPPPRYFSPPVGNTYLPSNNIPKAVATFGRGTSLFLPFQAPDINVTPMPREHLIHTLTPSPSIESARAG